MLRFAQTCDAIAATSKRLEKTALVADYLGSSSLPPAEAALAAIFLSGRPFPAYEEATLQVGGALLWRVISDLSGKSEQELSNIYRKHGDAGSVAAEALPETAESSLSLAAVQQVFLEIATARGPAAKAALLRRLLERATPLEAKYIVKIISGDLRIGLKESLVEEAIACAFEAPLDTVKRANMLLGDLGETLRLASAGKLDDARLRLFHPIDFMLASPVESPEEALSYFQNASVEDKYDGVRAQAHISRGEVRIFSRTRDEITESFPELPAALAGLPKDAILDGEIVAWNSASTSDGGGRALPFSTLQQRLGRKKVSAKIMHDVPIAYLVFDVLYTDGELLIDRPLRERSRILALFFKDLLAAPRTAVVRPLQAQSSLRFDDGNEGFLAAVLRAPVESADSAQDLEALFAAARDRGNEGLVIKDPDSPYTPGRRGKSWLKMKRELATLDVVVRTRQAHRRAQRLHIRSVGGRASGEYRQSIFRTDGCRDRRNDAMVSRA
jgi:DNA ligase 1